jgi:basic membrane lipoprotein Med (substrate-binding protein (PBP1-ABC) superfamily)
MPVCGVRAAVTRSRRGSGRGWWWGGAVALVLGVAGVVTAALWPSPESVYDPPARARQYIAFSACLLTGPEGLADAAAQAVWSGMQAASSATRAKVTYLAAVGSDESVGSVTPFVNSLVQRHCRLILTVGDVEVRAAQAVAASNGGTDFVLVGGGSAAANVAVLSAGDAKSVSTGIARLVEAAVGGGFRAGVVP